MLEKINKINPITNKEKQRYVEMTDLTSSSSNKFLRFNPISKEYYVLKYKILDDENDKNNKNLNL